MLPFLSTENCQCMLIWFITWSTGVGSLQSRPFFQHTRYSLLYVLLEGFGRSELKYILLPSGEKNGSPSLPPKLTLNEAGSGGVTGCLSFSCTRYLPQNMSGQVFQSLATSRPHCRQEKSEAAMKAPDRRNNPKANISVYYRYILAQVLTISFGNNIGLASAPFPVRISFA